MSVKIKQKIEFSQEEIAELCRLDYSCTQCAGCGKRSMAKFTVHGFQCNGGILGRSNNIELCADCYEKHVISMKGE